MFYQLALQIHKIEASPEDTIVYLKHCKYFWGFQYWCSTYCKILKLGSVFTKPFTFRYFTGYSVELQLTGTNRGKTARQTRKPFFSPTMLSLDTGGQCSKSRKFLKIQGSPVNTVSINAVLGVVRFQIPTQ